MLTKENLIGAISHGIATYEGFFKANSRPYRNNNPGDLREWGDLPTEGGYVKFPSDFAGWRALDHQVKKNIDRGLTLNEFFNGKEGVYPGFAPAADKNNPLAYASFVASFIKKNFGWNIPLDQPLNNLCG